MFQVTDARCQYGGETSLWDLSTTRGKPIVLKGDGKLFYVETDSALYEKAGSDH